MSAAGTLRQLSRDERLMLMRFVCSFAWADARVVPEERTLVQRLTAKLQLDAGERRQVQDWLDAPPPPESVDPKLVPAEHRALFVHVLESIVSVDGDVAPSERARLIELAKRLR